MTVMALRTTLMATSKQTSSQLLNMMLVLLLSVSVAVSQLARHLEPDDLSANPEHDQLNQSSRVDQFRN